MRHCWPVGEATEILGVRAVIAPELKQTRSAAGVRGAVKAGLPGTERPATSHGRRRTPPVGSTPMRILVTNDDGVGAPGLAALTRALVRWTEEVGSDGPAPRHEIMVVAPSSNYSGAGAAVGSVTDGTAIPYQRAAVEGAETVEAYGLDASPALSVIAGALGAVGPKPDLVLSGINHGVNVGRSVLHSGTVGAALTASQLGISALAVSLRAGVTPDPWESAADLAVSLIPVLVAAPVRTVLNLNVPALPLDKILGLRWARVSGAGLIKAATGAGDRDAPNRPEMEGPAAAEGAQAIMDGGTSDRGEIVLTVGSAVPRAGFFNETATTE